MQWKWKTAIGMPAMRQQHCRQCCRPVAGNVVAPLPAMLLPRCRQQCEGAEGNRIFTYSYKQFLY
jgi:hypothetical protein